MKSLLGVLLFLSTLAVPMTAATAHECVGEWRVDLWGEAIDGSGSVIELARPELVDLPVCDDTPAPHAPLQTAPRAFSGGVEQWRSTIEQFWHVRPGDALSVLSRESAGCQTAAAYHGCVGAFLPPQNETGCQARGLFQHCSKYWAERAVPGCEAIENIVDPYCNVATAHALWVASGCSFWRHWPATASGTGSGC